MNRIAERFATLKTQGRKGFVVYIGAGDPNLPGSWSIRYQEPWSSGITLNSVKFEVRIGTATADPVSSGILAVDNFRLARP